MKNLIKIIIILALIGQGQGDVKAQGGEYWYGGYAVDPTDIIRTYE